MWKRLDQPQRLDRLDQPNPSCSLTWGMVVQDAEAHQLAFDWKGATLVKCCPLCLNVVSKNCNLVRDPTGCTSPVYTTDTSRFLMCNNKTFRAIQNRLADVALNRPTELKDKEQDLGFQHNPDGWLQDPNLDVKAMQVLVFDWMHCWCEGGVWALELGACTIRNLHDKEP